MPAILALVALAFIVVLAVAVLSFAVHVLFSPWLLLVAAVGIVAWVKLRPRHSRR